MTRSVKLCFAAASVSFLGSLPLGTLNLSVANYMFKHDTEAAMGFAAASVMTEITVVRIALAAMKKLNWLKPYAPLLKAIGAIVLLLAAYNAMTAAYQTHRVATEVSFLPFHPVLAGLLLSATNPMHLPYWAGWIAVFRSNKILDGRPSSNNYFVAAIGAGTALAFLVYALAGAYLLAFFGSRQALLNECTALALLLTALLQLFNVFSKRRTRNTRAL